MLDALVQVFERLRGLIAAIEAGLLSFCEYVELLQMLSIVLLALALAWVPLDLLLDRVWCWGRHNLTRARRLSWVVATLVTLAYAPLTAKPVRDFAEAIEPAVEILADGFYGNKSRHILITEGVGDALDPLFESVIEGSPGLACLDRATDHQKWYYGLAGAPAIAWVKMTGEQWASTVLERSGWKSSEIAKTLSAANGSPPDLDAALKDETLRMITVRGMSTFIAAECIGDPKAPTAFAVFALFSVWCAMSTVWLLSSLLFAYVWLKPSGPGNAD